MTDSLRPKKSKVEKGEGLWLLSFTDLCMILIAFFILIISSSSQNKKKAEQIQEAMEARTKPKSNLAALEEKIRTEVKKNGLEASAKVTYDVDGLSIEFKDSLLFTSGSADSNPKFSKVVGSVMNVIASAPEKYQLILQGHTDDSPVAGGEFRSNWELSSARAITLMRQFEKKGIDPSRMSVTAFADTRPQVPIKGIKNPKALAKARAANRRVVIRIE